MLERHPKRQRKEARVRTYRTLTAGLVAGLLAAAPAAAEPVQIEHDGLRLNGNLEGEIATGPTVLMVHGTLAHHGMEIMRTLQDLLLERDIPSLAITLGLGIDDRTGMYDCGVPHSHRHEGAQAEIGVWRDWLENEGATEVVLLGHSRGGNQVARFLAEQDGAAAGVLIAPMTWEEADAAASYEQRGAELAPLLERAAGGERLAGVPFLGCPEATVEGASFAGYYEPDPRFDTPALLPEIEVPVLVIAGSSDDVVPDLADRLGEIDQPNVETTVIDGAGHFFIEFFAEDAADAIADFLEGRT